jgi:hypothetical protein
LDTARRVRVILAVDVEPDGRLVDPERPLPWRGFEALHAYLTDMRPRLARASGHAVRYCWFLRMDPQIAEVYADPAWAARHYASALARAIEAGDEVGLHQHAFRRDSVAGEWISDHANQPWVDHCVKTGFETYAACFGRPCRAFRFGDRWMNGRTLRLVEDLGAHADLTLEPGMPRVAAMVAHERHTGSLPDYSQVPYFMYRPRIDDFCRVDTERRSGIWMVPLTTGRVVARDGALARVLRRLALRRRPPGHVTSLNLAVSPPTFSQLLDRALERSPLTHIAMVVRSDAAIRPKYRANMQANLEGLLVARQRHAFAFSTVAETIGEAQGSERGR